MKESDKDRVLECINLLKHPKTKQVAVRCLIYISELAKQDPNFLYPDVQFGQVDRHGFHAKGTKNSYTITWEEIDMTLIVPKPTKTTKFSRKELPVYSELLKKALDALKDAPIECWTWSIIKVVERKISNYFKPMHNSHYTQFGVTDKTQKLIDIFGEFAVKSGDFTIEMADILLSSITSIASDLHTSRSSPIHLATQNNDLDAFIMLLSHDVYVDTRNEKHQTALQVALKNDQLVIAKTLILFGANVRSKSERKALRKVATGNEAKQILHDTRLPKKKKMKDLPRAVKCQMDHAVGNYLVKTHLLSLDGGGIRGLVMTTILAELENVLGKNVIRDKFSFMAGSSTGAILAIALAQGKTVAQCRNIYFKLKDIVFYRKSVTVKYSHELLEEFIHMELNGEKPMSSLRRERGKFIVVTASNVSSGTHIDTVLFKSYKIKAELDLAKVNDQLNADCDSVEEAVSDDEEIFGENTKYYAEKIDLCNCGRPVITTEAAATYIEGEKTMSPQERSNARRLLALETSCDKICGKTCEDTCPFGSTIKKAARCSSAAPTYFESPDKIHEDGGIIANNPSELLLTEFQHVNNAFESNLTDKMNLGIFLSLGTGHGKDKESSKCETRCGAEFTCSIIRFARKFFGQAS